MAHAPDAHLDPALRRLTGTILLGGIMGILDGSMIAAAADTLARDFSTSLATISWVSTSYLLALTLTIPVTTWAVDRLGGRRLWLLGLVVFLAGSVASGLAWNVGALIAARAVQGIGAGLLDPLMLTLLARAAGPARTGRVMGLMGVVGSSGPVFGPVAGGIILQSADWRWMFLVNVPIGLAALLLALKILPEDDPGTASPADRLDILGLALIGPGMAAGVLALSQSAERAAFVVPSVLVPLAVAVLLLGGYALHALRRREAGGGAPLIDLRLLGRRGFAPGVVIASLAGLATFASLFALPLYYQQVRGHDSFASALLLIPLGIGSALSMPLAGRLSDRVGTRGLVRGGSVLALLSAVALTRGGAQTAEVWPAAAAFTLGAGLGAVGAPTIASVYRTLPARLVPQGSSVLYMLNQLGASVGIAVVALVMQTAGDGGPVQGFRSAYWVVGVALALALAAATFLPGRPAPAPGAVDPQSDGDDVPDAGTPARSTVSTHVRGESE
ncbi:DHA2 family efflux MFS transporter permease subunit [Streptomyces sp. NPDC058221]|uniref:DHA2 family efflux MFS transporter permease subunit n=1 Tax=Streptomyces sp. NPDC058221 TaxID=3346388 RepID=UPI0036EC0027